MTSYAKTCTNRYLFKWLKIIRLPFVMGLTLIRCHWNGWGCLFVKNNHLLIWMTMVFDSEKYSGFQMAEVHQLQQSEHISLLAYMSRCLPIYSLKLQCKNQRTSKHFAHLSSCFQQALSHCGKSNMYVAARQLHFHQVIHITLIANPVSTLQPTNESDCYKVE